MKDSEQLKREAAEIAGGWIESGSVVGLGTGSTVRHLLDVISERLKSRSLTNIVGIPTSEATRLRSEELGIPLGDLESHPKIDIAIDGADEVTPNLDLIKGLGGALLREKLVAIDAARFIVMVDESKCVDRIGSKAPVPVEIDPFGLGIQIPFLKQFGCTPELRDSADGTPFRTDGGNLIIDCYFSDGLSDPAGFALELDRRPGIFENGLFLSMTHRAVVATKSGVDVRERPSR